MPHHLEPLPTLCLLALREHVGVVTGAGNGLGRAIAVGLGGAGARVVCADRNLDTARWAATEIDRGRVTALATSADVVTG